MYVGVPQKSVHSSPGFMNLETPKSAHSVTGMSRGVYVCMCVLVCLPVVMMATTSGDAKQRSYASPPSHTHIHTQSHTPVALMTASGWSVLSRKVSSLQSLGSSGRRRNVLSQLSCST